MEAIKRILEKKAEKATRDWCPWIFFEREIPKKLVDKCRMKESK